RHEAAVGLHKQRTFDDVLAVARWLIATGQTTPTQLGLWGASNGGLTAAACLTQAPELFGAVVLESALLDMLAYHRLGQGANWLAEYGSPDVPALRAVLAAYSPLHNVHGRVYPATLITTHEHDPRVGEAHSLRFAAALQAAQMGDAPITLRVYPGRGHGNLPADWLDFLADHLCS
ncbi:MAG: S9 family peptidase, partial [Anaerolineales bacterium]|nr:S9 family peptidase [Anaerolineales bacterium]